MNLIKIQETSDVFMQDLNRVRATLLSPIPDKSLVDEWVHEVGRRVVAFQGTILEFKYPDTKTVLYFAVMIAFAGPHELCLQRLTRLPRSLINI